MNNDRPANHTDSQIRARLTEDLGSPSEANELLPVVNRLQTWKAPQPTQRSTDDLIAYLAEELPPRKSLIDRIRESYPLLLLLSQLRVVRREIWLASGMLAALGLFVTLTMYDPASGHLAPIAVLAPIIAAIGVALIYDSDMEQVLEIETATRTSKQVLLLARLTLVYGFNLMLSFSISLVIALTQTDISLFPLVTSWFVPMTFLSAMAFFISIITGDGFLAWSSNIGIWSLHVFLTTRATTLTPILHLLSLPGLSDPQIQPHLFLMAIILVVIALWFTERSETTRGPYA